MWAYSLFALGIMFTTTRVYIFIFNLLNFGLSLSYFFAVWMAGLTSYIYLIAQEKSIDAIFPEGTPYFMIQKNNENLKLENQSFRGSIRYAEIYIKTSIFSIFILSMYFHFSQDLRYYK
jgi:hypothetical protein